MRYSDLRTLDATITDRGVAKAKDGRYYACYYCEIHCYAGSGWLGDIGGIKFENRINSPYQSGL